MQPTFLANDNMPRFVADAIRRYRIAPIKALRIYCRLTSKALSEEADVPYRRVLGFEDGRYMTEIEAARLSMVLKVPARTLQLPARDHKSQTSCRPFRSKRHQNLA